MQYDTGLSLPPGKYHLKSVAQKNQTGRMLVRNLDVPDLKSQPFKMSSIVLASQLQAAKKNATPNPLIRDGSEIIPNVTHVFSSAHTCVSTMRLIRQTQAASIALRRAEW